MIDLTRTTTHVALRILGHTGSEPTNAIRNQLHGIMILAINLNAASPDLLDINETATHLYMEMD